jgi:tight adherence protein B
METLIYLVLGVAVLLGAEAAYHLVRYAGERQRVRLKQRMRSLIEPGTGGSLLRERRIARNPALQRLLVRLPMAERLEALLLQTDLDWTVATVLGLGLLAGGGLTAVLLLVLRSEPLLALLGAPLGFSIPLLFVLNERNKRSQKISEQLPEALDMMARSLTAGHGMGAGFKLVATEMPPPIAIEFGSCFEEHNLGVEFRKAVTNMTMRVPENLDLKLFAVSVLIQHETGGNLVEILEKISHTLRERYKFYGKLRALTAEGRISAIILGALPFLCGLAIVMLNPKYIDPLFSDPLGKWFLLGGLSLWGTGILWLRQMAQVDY